MNFARELFSKRNRVLLKEMVKTDFKLRYQGSVLGHLWSILKPLALFAVMYVVFIKFLRFGQEEPPEAHFAMALLLGTTIWSFFSEAVMQGMNSIVGRGDLLRKINFPKIIVVISSTVGALINFGINLGVVLIFAIINGVHFEWHMIFAIPVFIQLYILALGLALFLGALYVKFRDISHIWEIIMQALFYMVPIIYPLSMVSKFSLVAAKILLLNPIAQIIQDARSFIIYDKTQTVWTYLNHWYYGLIPITLTVIIFTIGLHLFNKNSQKFAEEI